MNEQLMIHTPSAQYPIVFSEDWSGLPDALASVNLKGKRACIITDTNVAPLYARPVRETLLQVFEDVQVCTFTAGEKSKNLETIHGFYDFLMGAQADRKTVVFGLGGGVCGDMAGFTAATFMRGLPFVQLPTTLLSQVDSSVGGKVGVDYRQAKNLIGAFYQPNLVYMNVKTLDTLPKREFSAGMAEVIKYGMILSAPFFAWLQENRPAIQEKCSETLHYMLQQCCAMKAQVVQEDERDTGLREILNFGHTVGHAVESLLGFELLHGECVAIGMLAAMRLSNLAADGLKNELLAYHLPVSANGLTAEDIYSQMFMDKKVKNNRLSFVLLSQIGTAYRTTDVEKDAVIEAINSVI